MGLKFYVGEMQAQANENARMAQEVAQGSSTLQTAINQFLSAPLSGRAYDTAKRYFSVAYTPICRSLIMTAEAMSNAHKRMISDYQSSVSSIDTDEDEIQSQIDRFEQLKRDLENQMRTAKELQPSLERRYMNACDSIAKRREQIQKLYDFNGRSSSFFSEYEACEQELARGLAQVNGCKAWNASNGTFELGRLDMTWAKSINTRWDARQKAIDEKVKAYNLANQEVITKYDEYGNVLGVYVDGKYDAELTNTLQEAIRTKNFDLIKGFGSGFIDQLANNNGKSLLNEWFGERKFGAEFDGKKSYARGQFVADLFSMVQGGAEFIGGGLWAFGGSAASVFFSGGSGAVAVPAISAGGLAVSAHGAGVFTSAWNNLGNGYSYKPDNLAVNNMKEFFETDFGSELKSNVTKTKKNYKGQSVYRVDKNTNPNMKKGDQFYLDSLHKDHIEVFNSRGTDPRVLNLDGTLNENKTLEAIRQGRTLKK